MLPLASAPLATCNGDAVAAPTPEIDPESIQEADKSELRLSRSESRVHELHVSSCADAAFNSLMRTG